MSARSDQDHDFIRIVLADDHLVVRQGMVAILSLESDFKVIGEASDGLAAYKLYEQLQPDVLILDLRMPKMDGFETVQKLLGVDPDAQILIMTTYDSDEDIWRCLKAGAKGYLLKDASHSEIVSAVRTVAAGESFASSKLMPKIARRASAPELTNREHEVLKYLAVGMTNKEIAQELDIGSGTVKTHLRNLFKKLEVSTRSEAINSAVQRGLIRLD
ncbi:MAG: response regulator transcription factor [Verrucomicrobiota bacterium]